MHGCTLRSDFMALFGRTCFNGSLISRSHPIIQEISKRTSAAGDEFLSGFYEPVGALHRSPSLNIAGFSVNADMIRKKDAAYCSECCRDGHEYFIKDLKLASYCPYHLRKYLSRCPNCQVKLNWHAVDECYMCNHPLVSPPCSVEDAKYEQNLLNIFRSGDTQKFHQLLRYLTDLGYHVERATECSANRCLLGIAFALLEDDMIGVSVHLKKLKSLHPEIPAFIIAAKLSLFPYLKIRDCVRDFIKYSSNEHAEKNGSFKTPPVHSFSLTKRQIGAWLGIRQHYWATLRLEISIRPYKTRYNWQHAQMFSKKVLIIKLRNGFTKKKISNSERPPKNAQEKLQLSAEAIKSAIKHHLLTPKWGKNHKMYFDPQEIENFSKKFISVKLLSSQTKIPTNRIRRAISRLKIAPLNFESSILRRWLISTQTSPLIVEWCNKTEKQQRKFVQSSAALPQPNLAEGENWLPTAIAAKYLNTWTQVVRHLIKLGLLTNIRKSRMGGYLIEARTLKDFEAKYVSAAEVYKLLGCSRGNAAKLLKSFGISPLTGPKIDHNPHTFYSREKISPYTSMGDKLLSKKNNGYTILQASKKLQISLSTTLNMIAIGVFQLENSERLINHKIRCSSVDTFYKNYAKSTTIACWLKTTPPAIYKILSSLGINPVTGTPADTYSQIIYASKDIEKYFLIPDQQIIHPGEKPELALTHVRALWKKYNIGSRSFGQLFLSSGFTSPIRIGAATYLLQNDVYKVEEILNKYYTFSQADRYLDHRHTSNLIQRNKLNVVYPLNGYSNYPMIDKIQLQDYATEHGFV